MPKPAHVLKILCLVVISRFPAVLHGVTAMNTDPDIFP